MNKVAMKNAIAMILGSGIFLSSCMAWAQEASEPQDDLQIVSDLQLLDEIESLNQKEGSQIWLRSSDEEEEAPHLNQKKRVSCEDCYKPQ